MYFSVSHREKAPLYSCSILDLPEDADVLVGINAHRQTDRQTDWPVWQQRISILELPQPYYAVECGVALNVSSNV